MNDLTKLDNHFTFVTYRGNTPFYMVDNDDAPDDELWEIHCHYEPGKVFAKYAHEELAVIDVDSRNAGWQYAIRLKQPEKQ